MWSAVCGRAAGLAQLGLLLALLAAGSRAAKPGVELVTCGSVLKLFNTQHRVRLHSHDIKYGSGARGSGLEHRQGAGPGAGSLKAGWSWGIFGPGVWESSGSRAGGLELLGDRGGQGPAV